jgi:predicted ATPase
MAKRIGLSIAEQKGKKRKGHTWIEFCCSPYYQNTPFYPVIEQVQRLLQFKREDSPQEKLERFSC